jgi:hypothetical protein
MFYTIYKITNQIDGKFYIGSHKTKDLNDNYMGSGKYLKYAQEKYGIENFTKEILFVFDTPELMYAKEAEIVNEDFLVTENTYNLKVGGFGGWDYVNDPSLFHNRSHSKEHMTMMSHKGLEKRNKILKEYHSKEQWSNKFRQKVSEGVNLYFDRGGVGAFLGKTHTEETKRKLSLLMSAKQSGEKNSQFGTIWVTNGIINKKVKITDSIPEGWYKGRVTKRH